MTQDASSESRTMPFEPTVHQQAYDLLMGMAIARAIEVAVEFRLPDHAASGPISVSQLAKELRVDQSVLRTLLLCLSSVGIFKPLSEDTFAQTDLSTSFRSDLPGSWYGIAHMLGRPWSWRTWGGLPYTLKTGLPAFEQSEGKGFWSYMQEHPEEFAIFEESMTALSEAFNPDIVAVMATAGYLDGIQRVIDIGGGVGGQLAAILHHASHVHGVLFDLPPVITQAQTYMEQQGLRERCDLLPGNFFEHIPAGGDLYLLKHVLHDWTDQEALQILQHVRAALAEQGTHGRLLIIEYIVPPPPQPPTLWMFVGLSIRLLIGGGYERTEAQFRALLEQAGLNLVRVHATSTPDYLLEVRLA